MAAEREPIEIGDNPELLRLIQEVQASGRPCVLRRDGKDIAALVPVSDNHEPAPSTADDPLWEILGLAAKYVDLDSERPTDVASNKRKYLADAYADMHE